MKYDFESENKDHESKFGILRNSPKSIPKIAIFEIHNVFAGCKTSKAVVSNLVNGKKVFFAQFSAEQTIVVALLGPGKEVDHLFGFKRFMNLPDPRGSQVEEKIENLTDHLVELSLSVMKRNQSKTEGGWHMDGNEAPKSCSFSKEEVYFDNRCPKDPPKNNLHALWEDGK